MPGRSTRDGWALPAAAHGTSIVRGLDPRQAQLDPFAVPVLVSRRAARPSRKSIAVVRERAQRMLLALALSDTELSILLCDDAVIRALNLRHRGRDCATDVLAFAMAEGRPVPRTVRTLLGDVVISLTTATRQAKAAGRDPLAEVTVLLAHGLLHLLGVDHRTRTEERRMLARTDALVAAALRPARR
jgi:probable rRNA maturation factor